LDSTRSHEGGVKGHGGPDASPLKDRESFASVLGPLLFLAGIFFLNFLARIILAPLMPAIEGDLNLSHGEAGSFFLFISAGYFITLICSGFFSRHIRHSGAITLSALAVGVALWGICLCSSLTAIRTGLFVLGMAAGIYLPSGIAAITSLASSRHWGKAIAVHELAPNLSFVAAPLICEGLLLFFSWRGILSVIGFASVATAIAFALFGKGGDGRGEAPSFSALKVFFSKPSFWIMVLLFSLGVAGSLGVYTMLPLYLVNEQGIDRNWANTLIAVSRLSGLGVAFFSGWVTDRLGPKRTLAWVFLLTGATTMLLGATKGTTVLFFIFLQPLMAVCFFPPAFAALALIATPDTRNVVVSLTVPMGFMLGGGAVPIGIGLAGDLGSFAWGIAVLGGLIISGTALSLCLSFDRHKE